MEPWMMVVLTVGGVLGLGTILVVLESRREQQRATDLHALADQLALDFFPDGQAEVTSRLSAMPLMQQGHSRKLFNLIGGRANNVDLSLFDYQYTTGSGKHKQRHSLSVVVFQSPLLHLPEFSLGAESVLHRIASTFGYQDIDFAGYPRFNKKYLLRGPNEEAIRALFVEDVVQHFESLLDLRRTICDVEGRGSLLMIWTRREKPADLPQFLEQAFSTYAMLKSPAAETHTADA